MITYFDIRAVFQSNLIFNHKFVDLSKQLISLYEHKTLYISPLIASTSNDIGNTGIFNCIIVYLQATFLTPPPYILKLHMAPAQFFKASNVLFRVYLSHGSSSQE